MSFNERWAEIIGYTVDELEPIQFDTWANNLHPDDLILAKDLLDRHWKGELALYEIEARMKHKDGHCVWVLASGRREVSLSECLELTLILLSAK